MGKKRKQKLRSVQYLQYLGVKTALLIARLLPIWVLYAAARMLGTMLYWFGARRRDIAATNIRKACHGELGPDFAEMFCVVCARCEGKYLRTLFAGAVAEVGFPNPEGCCAGWIAKTAAAILVQANASHAGMRRMGLLDQATSPIVMVNVRVVIVRSVLVALTVMS